jgi:Glycosyl transferase family 2
VPLVSVVIPSYNHGRFVAESVQSALAQSFRDLEVVVVDDGSRDNSVEVLRAIDDSRLKVIAFSVNKGAAEATNTGIEHSHGTYIAILNSDDVWDSHKIARQLTAFERNADLGAVFTWARLIDEDGGPAPPGIHGLERVFEQPNRSRGGWLRRFFFEGNCLCHPSILVRRAVYENVGLYDERFRQIPDLHMWIRMCRAFDIHVIPEKLVAFRILKGEGNTGLTRSPGNSRRAAAETMLLADQFFEDLDLETFVNGFLDRCVGDKIESQAHARIEQAFLLVGLDTRLGACYRPAGMRRLFDLLGEPQTAAILRDRYRFGPREFHELLGRTAILGFHPDSDATPVVEAGSTTDNATPTGGSADV